MYYCCGLSRKGIPAANEDSMLLGGTVVYAAEDRSLQCDLTSPFTIALADGVGGKKGGAAASRLAMEKMKGYVPSKRLPLAEKIERVHKNVADGGARGIYGGSPGMQCTLCALIGDEQDRFLAVNVGDSRIYRYRQGHIEQISKDQSMVQILYDKGSISLEQKLSHTDRNLILSALGGSTPPKPVVRDIGTLKHGDLLIMCTDGVCDYISGYDLEEILALPMQLPKRLARICDEALKGGSHDNMTIIGLSYKGNI